VTRGRARAIAQSTNRPAVAEHEERQQQREDHPGDDLRGEGGAVDDGAVRAVEQVFRRVARLLAQAVDRRARHLERAVLDEPVLDVVGGLRQRRSERVRLVRE
jgi:hypothetical protein